MYTAYTIRVIRLRIHIPVCENRPQPTVKPKQVTKLARLLESKYWWWESIYEIRIRIGGRRAFTKFESDIFEIGIW